jgi:hypothetical protein
MAQRVNIRCYCFLKKLQLLCFTVLKSCECYYSMSFLWQCLKIMYAKYWTQICLLSLSLSLSFFFLSVCLSVHLFICQPACSVCPSVSLSISLSACLSIYLLKPEPVGPESPKFGPARLGLKPRPIRAWACSLFSKRLSQSPTFGLGLRPDPALTTIKHRL